jgi:hypothetical protein
MKIAQTHTEQINSPIMTVFTIQWACQNSVNSERSEEVSGNTDCATSGFMSTSFPLSGCGRLPTALVSNGKSVAAIRHALRRKLGRRENRLSPTPSGPSKSARNLAELGRGRAPNPGFAV